MKHKFNSKTAKAAKAKAAKRGPNKTTKLTRELITGLIEDEYENIKITLKKLKTRRPHVYVSIMLQFMEYCLPKLNRTELTGKDGKDFFEQDLSKLGPEDLKKLTEIHRKMSIG